MTACCDSRDALDGLFWQSSPIQGNTMKYTIMTAVLAGLVATSTVAIAQSQSQSSSQMAQSDNSASTTNETMKQCMAHQKATNSGLTNLQMKTTCRNEMKASKTHKEGNDLATGTQTGDKQSPQQQ
jgi:hypothetical protein